ncbi:Dockerin type I repeat protein [Rubripirellula tenax]|uniref:Dockerin type I repeat protein n=1 Tax=Rubripirellula tenax TaxID=2528015 RepID=A0A5C6FDJ1_9BACT|nr:dockerin type I domain-containing protein [Rubripirellula tenax]TWU59485.1 Dockerin type I repeat protein [Rubripirellula tenax]
MPRRFLSARQSERRRRQLRRLMNVQRLETRQLMAADSIGVTPQDTGEFLLGSVGVTPVFLESNGEIDAESQNWTATEIDEMLAKVTTGVNWWSDTLDSLDTVHDLEFVVDDTYARTPFETPYEPIDRSTGALDEYIGHFVTELGYGDARSIEEAVQRFNHDQRLKLGTDWAFTIFVADSSDDPDGLFASGGSFSGAFAFAGGLFVVTPSTRPASTITHEMGHIFWARDEYQGGGSYTDRRGYYDTQNLNAADNPSEGFVQEISIMRGGVPLQSAYEAHVSPAVTLAMVGWQDSDGDGIFDLADVPHAINAVGHFDVETSLYQFTGTASAVPLRNRNSSGVQSDITLGRISELQYRLDDGAWTVAATPDSQVASFDVSVMIDEPFSTIDWRVIDTATGVTSPLVSSTRAVAAVAPASIAGVVFFDENGDGIKSIDESTLAMTRFDVTRPDGSPLFGGRTSADDLADGVIDDAATGSVSIAADGLVSDEEAGAFVIDGTDQRVFQSFDLQRSQWIHRWSSRVAMTAAFDETVGDVSVSFVGLDETSYGRVEAFDSDGNLIGRQTSAAIGEGQSVVVEVTDPRGSIASIRVFGHANTSVAISALEYGVNPSTGGALVTTDVSGALRLANLPDGTYSVSLAAELPIHSFGSTPIEVTVSGGTSSFVVAGATRVDSPRYNAANPADANQDEEVTARDALVIINDVTRNGSRILDATDTVGFDVDVNNDGSVSALDALVVINELARRQNSGNGEHIRTGSADELMRAWPEPLPISADSPKQVPQTASKYLSQTGSSAASLPIAQSEMIANVRRMFNFDGSEAVDEREYHWVADTTFGADGQNELQLGGRERFLEIFSKHDRQTASKTGETGTKSTLPQEYGGLFTTIDLDFQEPLGDSAL